MCTPGGPGAAVFFAVSLTACGPTLRQVVPVGRPTTLSGRVAASRGPTLAQTGDDCVIELHRTDGSFLNCRIRVRCSGDAIYGLAGAGFNRCREEGNRFVFAQDHNGTRVDGDPRMVFDRQAGRIIVADDDPDVEVLVDLLASKGR